MENREDGFVETVCECCGDVMYLTEGALARRMASSGTIICDACQREIELMDTLELQRLQKEKDLPPAMRRTDLYVWVGMMALGVFLGMQVWLLWPDWLNNLKLLPMIAMFIAVALMISQLRTIIRGEVPIWRKERK